MIPCEECLVVAICKNKHRDMPYLKLLGMCETLRNYLYIDGTPRKKSRRPHFFNSLRQLDEVFDREFSLLIKQQDILIDFHKRN